MLLETQGLLLHIKYFSLLNTSREGLLLERESFSILNTSREGLLLERECFSRFIIFRLKGKKGNQRCKAHDERSAAGDALG